MMYSKRTFVFAIAAAVLRPFCYTTNEILGRQGTSSEDNNLQKVKFSPKFHNTMENFANVKNFADVEYDSATLDEFAGILKNAFFQLPSLGGGWNPQGTFTQWQGQYTGNIYTDYMPPSIFDFMVAARINQAVFERNKPVIERYYEIKKGLGAIDFIKRYKQSYEFLKENPSKKSISPIFKNWTKHNERMYFKDGIIASKALDTMKSNLSRAKQQVYSVYTALR